MEINNTGTPNIQVRGEVNVIETQFKNKKVEVLFRERSSNYIFESKASVLLVFINNTVQPQASFDFDIKGHDIDVDDEELIKFLVKTFESFWIKDIKIGSGIFKLSFISKGLTGLFVKHIEE